MQYENINRLLGPSTHGTASGDLCESLLREFLRRFLPPTLSVDKGYFYGRSVIEGQDTHSPEIDILVHDTHSFVPLSRTGDFVIVRPQAVRAMIQVKRTLTNSQVASGLKNVIQAKQQLIDVLRTDQKRAVPDWTGSMMPPRVFTAIVGFESRLGKNLKFYRDSLLKWHLRHRAYDREKMTETSMYVLPSFIGSLKHSFLFLDGPCNFINQRYLAFESEHCTKGINAKRTKDTGKAGQFRKNVCLQALLAKMYNVLGGEVTEMPPLAFPPDLRFFDSFAVLRFDVELSSNRDAASLRRNDGWTARYRREDGPTKELFHVLCDENDCLTQTELMRTDRTPQELFVKRHTSKETSLERYVRHESSMEGRSQ